MVDLVNAADESSHAIKQSVHMRLKTHISNTKQLWALRDAEEHSLFVLDISLELEIKT